MSRLSATLSARRKRAIASDVGRDWIGAPKRASRSVAAGESRNGSASHRRDDCRLDVRDGPKALVWKTGSVSAASMSGGVLKVPLPNEFG